MSEDRYSRQRRLSEVAESGQSRLANARVTVAGRDGADVEIRYLVGAGVGDLSHAPDAEPVPFRHAPSFQFASARRVAAGAWRALVTLRQALESAS
jgi:molybdopterin/thiamine biosynthesis adenylyltransferase